MVKYPTNLSDKAARIVVSGIDGLRHGHGEEGKRRNIKAEKFPIAEAWIPLLLDSE